MNIILYLLCITIWGTTWYGIKLQAGAVAADVSIVYRFALGSFLLLSICWLRKKEMRFSLKAHAYFFLLGNFLFGINYYFAYLGVGVMTSGLACIVFSTMIIFNMTNQAIFLKKPIEPIIAFGALIGLTGVALTFIKEIIAFDVTSHTLIGFFFMILCTAFASWGNTVSVYLKRYDIPVLQTTTYGMSYGTLSMFIFCLIRGSEFNFDMSTTYISSLLYLAILGSALVFWIYLQLVRNIGPDRAAYAFIMTPIVALGISTLFEDYHWPIEAVIGVSLTLCGNILILYKQHKKSSNVVSFKHAPTSNTTPIEKAA